jgi:hypothetical protein
MRSQHLGFGGGTKLKKKIRGAKLKKKKKIRSKIYLFILLFFLGRALGLLGT